MAKSIGYHTRSYNNNSVKIVGGSFGGSIDMETVNRLVKSHFTVKVKPSGRAVFVDNKDREVSLYVSIDPSETDAGKLALTEYRKASAKFEQEEAEKRERIQEILDSMSADKALRLLSDTNNE